MNTNTPQGTGAMTLDQGVAHVKAKLAERGASIDDQAIVHPDADDEIDHAANGMVEDDAHSALDETAEGVSGDASDDPAAEPDERLVTLPDGSRITVAEARKGYLRQADFTRKTTELAQARKALAAREQAAMQELSSLYQHMDSLEAMEPNWAALARGTDPARLAQAQAHWRDHQVRTKAAKQAVAQALERNLSGLRKQMWDTLSTGSFDPAWKDPKTLKSSLDSLSDYLVERGIPAAALSTLHMPVVIEIAEESRRYRELQKARPKAALAVRGKPMPFRPGAKNAASPGAENIRGLSEAFRKNPSIDNAVALQKAKASVRRR